MPKMLCARNNIRPTVGMYKITVKSTKSGMHLAYRQGYFGRPEGDAQQKSADLQEAACQDMLISTSVLMVAKQYPADQPGKAKYFMAIYPSTVTFVPRSDGSRGSERLSRLVKTQRAGRSLDHPGPFPYPESTHGARGYLIWKVVVIRLPSRIRSTRNTVRVGFLTKTS